MRCKRLRDLAAYLISKLNGNDSDSAFYFLRLIYMFLCMFLCICITAIVAIYFPFKCHFSSLYSLNLNLTAIFNGQFIKNNKKIFNDSIDKNSFRKSQKHLILFWTKDQENRSAEMQFCPNSFCFLSRDRKKIFEAKAVVFNMRYFNSSDLPPIRFSHQYYVFAMRESPSMVPLDEILQKQMDFFNLTMTYR